MAAYIQIKQSLLSDRKIIKAANILNVSRPTTAGMVIAIWLWAIDHAPHGDLGLDFPEYAKDIANYDGDTDDLMEALRLAEWIAFDEGEAHDTDVDDEPTWQLVGWDDASGPLVVMVSANK